MPPYGAARDEPEDGHEPYRWMTDGEEPVGLPTLAIDQKREQGHPDAPAPTITTDLADIAAANKMASLWTGISAALVAVAEIVRTIHGRRLH
jgi:hypothetical protein